MMKMTSMMTITMTLIVLVGAVHAMSTCILTYSDYSNLPCHRCLGEGNFLQKPSKNMSQTKASR